jgi:hypothetical protein
MAKNNFKKKKTLKRSLRRNHTKKVASALLGSRTPNIRKKNRRSQKQRTTLRNKRNARVKIGGGWFGKSNAELQREKEERQREEEERRKILEKEEIKKRKERAQRNAERDKEIIQKDYYFKILPTIKKIIEEMAHVRNDEDGKNLFRQVNTLIKTSPGLSKEYEDSVKYEVMKAFESAKELNNFETHIYRWYSGDDIDYQGDFYTQF